MVKLLNIKSFIINVVLFGMSAAVFATDKPANSLDAGMVNPGYEEKPAWFKNSFLDIREDVEEAASEKKRVMLYFYQDGCPYCAKLLRDNFSQRAIEEKTRQYFDVIAVNMWGDREVTGLDGQTTTEKNFAAKLKVMFTPTILMLDETGRVKLRINGYYFPAKFAAALEFAGNPDTKEKSFAEYFQKQSPSKASGKLHGNASFQQPPFDLSKLAKSDKPLLVLFEQKVCQPCDEQHGDIFKRKETRQQLQRFNIVRLDMWANTPVIDTKGQKTTAKKLAKAMDVKYAPSMIFLDQSGKEVFRSEAYLKAFHTQSILDYVASGAYKQQPNFQRYIASRADKLEAQGVHVNLME